MHPKGVLNADRQTCITNSIRLCSLYQSYNLQSGTENKIPGLKDAEEGPLVLLEWYVDNPVMSAWKKVEVLLDQTECLLLLPLY